MPFIKYSDFFLFRIFLRRGRTFYVFRDEAGYLLFFFFAFTLLYEYLWVIVCFNFTNQIKYYYGYAYTTNTFVGNFFTEKMCAVFTVIDFRLVFKYFSSKTSWVSNAFSMMLLTLSQIALYFSNNSFFLISKDLYLVFFNY